mmetsp:Transcript_19711/g.36301  ORF Transcript_19711/g.36301 Transcript_19711/m.36301 type:complete len:252 (-) Transcript_19711:128-883(-)|eukprot:CAMPEP_0204904348 /NCGR_PEP_ID=MMETSP1397-20131031/4812_1 /ASSEMBLY_ACC=CAM_ASM_000891 /TAXON_ID=49980 /ORGANISM="Climacostomum Climacostomum virens, Strain Stock W-24" /LENGTH=251 /DNA_ID=CAMNT_0052073129 /DNA_START=1296 /DNA_END=2051 /DNA_ORIENTATION=-
MSGQEEWTGAKSSKFRGGISTKADQPVSKEASLLGRKHYEERLAQPQDTGISYKRLEPQSSVMKAQGTKVLPFKPTESKPRAERKHVPPYDSKTCNPEYPKVQNRVRTSSGTLVQYTPTPEYDDHQRLMGRKTRVRTYEKTRNLLPVKAPGDKIYKKVEQSTNFYKGGGLIVGSTAIKRYPHQSKIGASDFATVISYESLNPNRKKWTDTVKQWQLSEEQGDVKQLVSWERQTLKETVPGYREVSDSEEEK